MTRDARFEDAYERPLNLGANDQADVQVLSALLQDAVLQISDVKWQRKQRRVVMLLNRFRWERENTSSQIQGHSTAPERVQSLLTINSVARVASQGFDKSDKDLILSLLQLEASESDKGDIFLMLTLAGDGAFKLDVDLIEINLRDVTRPYLAPSGQTPHHPE